MKEIPMYIESKNGHDTINVPRNEATQAVQHQLNNDKWVTLENKDGTSELLTKQDAPQTQDWKGTFKAEAGAKTISSPAPNKTAFHKRIERAKSITVNNKAKGG